MGHETQRGQLRIDQVCDAYVVPLPADQRARLRECLMKCVWNGAVLRPSTDPFSLSPGQRL